MNRAMRQPSMLNKLITILCFLFLGCAAIWSFADRQAYYDRHGGKHENHARRY